MSGPYSTCKLVLDANGAPVIMSGPDQNEDLSLVTASKDLKQNTNLQTTIF